MRKLWNLVVQAWNCLKMDDMLASAGNMGMEEGLLVCPFRELATNRGTYPERSLAVVTTHYTQMVWLHHRVNLVGRRMCDGKHPIQVILVSLVSHVPRIMSDMRRGNTLTIRAQPELNLLRAIHAVG